MNVKGSLMRPTWLRFSKIVILVITLEAAVLLTVTPRGPATSASSYPQGGALTKQLIGTWRVVSLDSRKDGHSAWKPDYGIHPTGYIQYDPNGRMSVQFCADPPTKKFASDDDDTPTPDEAKAAYLKYVAYFGTYTVDEKKHIVTHHVEGSLTPSYTGTDQLRPFVLEGDRLTIAAEENDGSAWRRVFERIK